MRCRCWSNRASILHAQAADGAEPPCATDLHALLDSLICDYTDAGENVRLTGDAGAPVTTRPRALRRVVTNLIDNALKFGCEVEVKIIRDGSGGIAVSVMDRGPGIPAEQLQSVLQPFVRLEQSRNRDTGGSGLGLAIAQQLATHVGRHSDAVEPRRRRASGSSSLFRSAEQLEPLSLRHRAEISRPEGLPRLRLKS